MPVLLFAYLVAIRTWGVAGSFWLLEDQERDWSWALLPIRELRLTGSPSHVGGNTLGPLWYWMLWASRHVIGPFTGGLPHTGAYALALVQSAADACLLVALQRKTGSALLAFGAVLAIATAPADLSLTAAMWSPEFSVALAKITIALVLVSDPRPGTMRAVAIAGCAWLTLQAHSSGLFVALPILIALVGVERYAAGPAAAARRAAALVTLILVMQVPFVIDALRSSEPLGPGMVVASITSTIAHPSSIHLASSFASVGSAANVVIGPWSVSWFKWVVVACMAAAAWRFRREPVLLAATAAPLVALVAGFALVQLPFDTYYLLPLAPGIGIVMALAVRALPGAAPQWAGAALSLAVVCAQPSRIDASWRDSRFPYYGALARGSREIRRRMPEVQNIETSFPLPPTTDPNFIYWSLGGRILATSRYAARIGEDGSVSFAPAAP